MPRRDDTTAQCAQPPSTTHGSIAPIPDRAPAATEHCLECGYARAGLSASAPCPECGAVPEIEEAAQRCAEVFAHPLRRVTRQLCFRRASSGWWSLLPASQLHTRARIQLLIGIAASALILLSWLPIAGSFFVVVSLGSPRLGLVQQGSGPRTVVPVRVSFAGIVRADAPWRGLFVAKEELRMVAPVGDPPSLPPTPFVERVPLRWSPYLAAQVAWISCASALAFLALRFLLLPLAIALGGGAPHSTDRAAASVAADASIGSAAVAFALIVVGAGAGLAAAAALAPRGAGDWIAHASPLLITLILAITPPALVANEIRSDRSRRVFPRPLLTAALALGTYLIAAASALVLMGVTFRIASLLLA